MKSYKSDKIPCVSADVGVAHWLTLFSQNSSTQKERDTTKDAKRRFLPSWKDLLVCCLLLRCHEWHELVEIHIIDGWRKMRTSNQQ